MRNTVRNGYTSGLRRGFGLRLREKAAYLEYSEDQKIIGTVV